MPCSDITETLRLVLDEKDCVLSYALHKRTCGGAVGAASLILEWARGRHGQEVLDAEAGDFLTAFRNIQYVGGSNVRTSAASQMQVSHDFVQKFLCLKHFFALQHGLAVLFGARKGGVKDTCTVDHIVYTSDGTELTAHIKVKVLTEQIQQCGSCMNCGSKNPALSLRMKSESLV